MGTVGGLLAIFGLLRTVGIFYRFATTDVPVWISEDHLLLAQWDMAIYGASAAISFICGVFILQGANWARWLFTVKWALFLLLTITDVALTGKDIPALAFLVLVQGTMVVILFLPDANRYFSSDY